MKASLEETPGTGIGFIIRIESEGLEEKVLLRRLALAGIANLGERLEDTLFDGASTDARSYSIEIQGQCGSNMQGT